MALTRDFRVTVKERAERDPEFRRALLQEAMQVLVDGDWETAATVLRDYVNATVGFEALGTLTGHPSKSLMRMLSAAGNPRSRNLLSVLGILLEREGVRCRITLGDQDGVA